MTEMQRVCRKMFLALVILVVVLLVAVVLLSEGCGRPSAPAPSSPLVTEEGEVASVPAGTDDPPFQGKLVLQLWVTGELAGLTEYSEAIKAELSEVLADIPEGANTIVSSEGESCLFRWLATKPGEELDFPVSRESFGSQLPGHRFRLEYFKVYPKPIPMSDLKHSITVWLRIAAGLEDLPETFEAIFESDLLGDVGMTVERCGDWDEPQPDFPEE